MFYWNTLKRNFRLGKLSEDRGLKPNILSKCAWIIRRVLSKPSYKAIQATEWFTFIRGSEHITGFADPVTAATK